MSKVTKKDLLERIEILEQKEKQRGIGNNFMTLKCIQGNRTFTKDVTYAASKTFDSIVITNNFGSVRILEENKNMFGGYKVTHDTQTAVFQVIGTNVEIEPKLKQLEQSVFDGLDDKWQWATMSSVGIPFVYSYKPAGNRAFFSDSTTQELINAERVMRINEHGYDTTDWQNSLIERDIAKELLEIDLSSELTGSELCRAMLARGDKFVMCLGGTLQENVVVVARYSEKRFYNHKGERVFLLTPINNMGEPLTAADVGL